MRDLREERQLSPRPPLPRRSEEHIDIRGNLKVPVVRSLDKAPARQGWEPYWVNIDLNNDRNDGVQKVVSYRAVA